MSRMNKGLQVIKDIITKRNKILVQSNAKRKESSNIAHPSPSLSQSSSLKQSKSSSIELEFIEKSNDLIKEISNNIRSSVRLYTSQHQLNLIGISTSRSLLQSYNKDDDDTIQIYSNKSIESYSEALSKTCKEDNINYTLWRIAGGYNKIQQIDNLIRRANSLDDVDGIILYYPLLSNKPQVLGWENRKGIVGEERYDVDQYGNRKWTIENEEMNVQNGLEDLLERNRRKIPGFSYKTRDDFYRSLISYQRDVEGLCPTYHSRSIFRNAKVYVDKDHLCGTEQQQNGIIFPCTALAVVKILEKIVPAFNSQKQPGKRFENIVVTIINRSEILGRPLASMLANDGAIVYSIDKDSILLYSYRKMRRIQQHDIGSMLAGSTSTIDRGRSGQVESCVKKSNVIVTGVPSTLFKLPTSWIQPGSQVINVASEPNIDVEELSRVPEVSYIPQIGKVTVALLEHNLVKLHERHHKKCVTTV